MQIWFLCSSAPTDSVTFRFCGRFGSSTSDHHPGRVGGVHFFARLCKIDVESVNCTFAFFQLSNFARGHRLVTFYCLVFGVPICVYDKNGIRHNGHKFANQHSRQGKGFITGQVRQKFPDMLFMLFTIAPIKTTNVKRCFNILHHVLSVCTHTLYADQTTKIAFKDKRSPDRAKRSVHHL